MVWPPQLIIPQIHDNANSCGLHFLMEKVPSEAAIHNESGDAAEESTMVIVVKNRRMFSGVSAGDIGAL
jgi:hypothetical protein